VVGAANNTLVFSKAQAVINYFQDNLKFLIVFYPSSDCALLTI